MGWQAALGSGDPGEWGTRGIQFPSVMGAGRARTEFSTTGKLNRAQHPKDAIRETSAHVSPRVPLDSTLGVGECFREGALANSSGEGWLPLWGPGL